jgi:hypothetical protein
VSAAPMDPDRLKRIADVLRIAGALPEEEPKP